VSRKQSEVYSHHSGCPQP